MYILTPVLVGILLCIHGTHGQFSSQEKKLFDALLGEHGDDHNKYIRPVNNVNDTVTVSFAKTFLEIEELDTLSQTLSIHGWLKMSWNDASLKWNPKDFGDLNEIRLPIDKIWRPDIMLYNSRDLSLWDSTMDVLALVYADGTVLWIPPARLVVGCAMDMTHFPWDKHHCHLQFGSWTYDATKVNLTWMGEPNSLDMDQYKEHEEWELEEYKAERNEKIYPCCPNAAYVDIKFNLTLKRRGSNYMHLVVGPSVALMFVTPAVFILPPDSGAKIHLGVGILIAQALLLSSVEQMIPGSNPTVPVIVLHFITNMVLTSISLWLAAVVVQAWSKSNRNSMMHWLLRSVVLGILGRMLCVKRETFMPVEGQETPGGRAGVTMQRLDVEDGSEPVPGSFGGDDKERMMATYARLTTVSEWRQLASILDRLLFLIYVAVSFCVLFALH